MSDPLDIRWLYGWHQAAVNKDKSNWHLFSNNPLDDSRSRWMLQVYRVQNWGLVNEWLGKKTRVYPQLQGTDGVSLEQKTNKNGCTLYMVHRELLGLTQLKPKADRWRQITDRDQACGRSGPWAMTNEQRTAINLYFSTPCQFYKSND